MKLVSVIITTYHRDVLLLCEAIESAIDQTYKAIEIIVVDDNGKDSSYQVRNQEVLSKYPEVIYLINEKNAGAQYSRNKGILVAKGDYIAFLDDDDIWKNDKIEKQLAEAEKTDAGLVFCSGYEFDGTDRSSLRPYEQRTCDGELTFDKLILNDFIGTTTQAFIDRNVFDKIGLFDENMPARQDYEMWLRISLKFKIVKVDEALFFHRIHEGTQISKDYEKSYEGIKRIYEKYSQQIKGNPFAKAKLQLKLAIYSKKKKNIFRCSIHIIKALIYSPKCCINSLQNFGKID